MTLSTDVFTSDGRLLVRGGSTLNPQEFSYSRAICKGSEFVEFQKHYTQGVAVFQSQLTNFVHGNSKLNPTLLLKDTLELFEQNRFSFHC